MIDNLYLIDSSSNFESKKGQNILSFLYKILNQILYKNWLRLQHCKQN